MFKYSNITTTEGRDEKGFTLIEALVTLILLSIAMIPMLAFATFAVNTAAIIRDNMIAANLNQEGLEVVRSIRDANWFNNRAFDNGLADGAYRVEYNSDSLLGLADNPPLTILNGVYSYNGGGTPTIFRRTITITKINAAEIRAVATVVRTTRGNSTKSVSAESHLFNWK
jgi:prepilin-type N-terminal cleavage/methylation domain-containing protein